MLGRRLLYSVCGNAGSCDQGSSADCPVSMAAAANRGGLGDLLPGVQPVSPSTHGVPSGGVLRYRQSQYALCPDPGRSDVLPPAVRVFEASAALFLASEPSGTRLLAHGFSRRPPLYPAAWLQPAPLFDHWSR